MKFIFCLFYVLCTILLQPQTTFAEDTKKEIYLTFDDGPSKIVTPQILDILKEENVKATFFIVGNEIKNREDILKRIHDDGHTIGLHSTTHDRKNLYSSNQGFLDEMLHTQNLINDLIGIKPTILRFPFGCNNSTYKLKESLVNLLHENNLKIYDWTHDSCDGAEFTKPPQFFVKNSISNDNFVMLLMHCGTVNKNSPEALKSIIKYYKKNGYEFKQIDSTTPEVFHYIKPK